MLKNGPLLQYILLEKARKLLLTRTLVNYGRNFFYNVEPSAKCYKSFSCRNLQMFVISYCVYPWQAFPALLMFVGKAGSLS